MTGTGEMISRWYRRRRLLGWAALFWLRRVILRQPLPRIGGLVLNESCNLNCRHCRVNRCTSADLSFAEALTGLRVLFRRGARALAITGGEPLIWGTAGAGVAELIREARAMGFLAVSVYTNGTLPFDHLDADAIFISLDGREPCHDALRGPGVFRKVAARIAEAVHPNLFINQTINAGNVAEVEPMCRWVAAQPNLRGIFFYFHTPYYGIDELFLPLSRRRELIGELLRLKRQNLPVVNSASCLKLVAADRWKRPADLCLVYADRKLFRCCRAVGNALACDNCGYLGYPELQCILQLRPDAVAAAFGYLAGGGKR